MYRLIFADDEAIVRRNISRLIKWNEYGFEFVNCCTNGHELLELVEAEHPDLVITDINMPFINGIQAAQHIREDFPMTKIVFLTGYSDFEYVQTAVDLKVHKYILKPVTADNMKKVLTDIKQELDDDYRKNRDLEHLKKFYDMHKSVLRNVFLNNLITKADGAAEIQNRIQALELECLNADRFQIAVLKEDGRHLNDQWESVSEEIVHFAIFNIVTEILTKNHLGTAVIMEKRFVLFLTDYSKIIINDSFTKRIEICLEEIRAAIEKYLKMTATIGVGNICHNIADLKYSFEDAVAALGYRNDLGTNRIIYICDIEPKRQKVYIFDEDKERQLLEAVKHNEREQMESILDNMLSTINWEEQSSAHIYVAGIILCLLREANKIGLDTEKICQPEVIFEQDSPEKIRETILKACEFLSSSLKEKQNNIYSKFVTQVSDFIQKNYTDPDLSIGKVSDHLHLSYSYFRFVFKKEIGTTFGNYLTQIRMKQAKELLLTTDMRNYEITEAVGYADPHYFSYCFKRYYNMSPNQMREQAKY